MSCCIETDSWVFHDLLFIYQKSGSVTQFTLMPNGQDHCIFTIVAVQNDIATVSNVNYPFAELRLHVLYRAADTRLLGDDIHFFANTAHRTLGGIYIFFREKSVKPR